MLGNILLHLRKKFTTSSITPTAITVAIHIFITIKYHLRVPSKLAKLCPPPHLETANSSNSAALFEKTTYIILIIYHESLNHKPRLNEQNPLCFEPFEGVHESSITSRVDVKIRSCSYKLFKFFNSFESKMKLSVSFIAISNGKVKNVIRENSDI